MFSPLKLKTRKAYCHDTQSELTFLLQAMKRDLLLSSKHIYLIGREKVIMTKTASLTRYKPQFSGIRVVVN